MKNQVILITGAAGGLGSALAESCLDRGANLLLLDRRSRDLEALSDRLVDKGLPAPGICEFDLAKATSQHYAELAGLLESEFGGLDVFIHCAAAFDGLRPLDQASELHWEECFKANVISAWHVVSKCLPMLRRSEQGRVVLLGEDQRVCESAYWGPYGVSKAALKSLGQILMSELEGSGVDVLWHVPKPMRTALRSRAYLAEDPESLEDPANEAITILERLI